MSQPIPAPTLEAALAAAELRAEQAERSLRRLEGVFNVAQLGWFEWLDVEGDEVFVSSHFYRRLGYSDWPERVSPDFLRPLVHEDDRAGVQVHYQTAIRDLGEATYIVRLLAASGEWQWHQLQIRATRAEANGVVSLTCVAQNIHDRTVLATALRESNEQLSRVVEAAGAGVWDWHDHLETYFEVTPSMQRLLGYQPEDEVTNDIMAFGAGIHPDDLATAAADSERALADPAGNYRSEFRFKRQDGTYHWVRSVGKVLPLAKPGHFRLTGALFDIHEARTAELHLAETLSQLHFVIEAARAGVYDVPDTGNSEVQFSDSLLELLGYDRGESFVTSGDMSGIIHPDDLDRLVDYQAALLEMRGDVYDQEFRVRRRDGGYLWVRSRGKVIPLSDDGRFRITGAMFDIQQEKVAQQALEDALANLEQFTYVVAHDLVAPLRHIEGYASALQEELTASPPIEAADAKAYLTRIVEVSRRSQTMIAGLLEFSRLGTVALRQERVDLAAVVTSLREMLDANDDCTWVVGELPVIYGDEVQLTLLFQNLLANAVKFSRPLAQQPRIEVHVSSETPTGVEICVRDNGVGFPPTMAKEIFEVFARAQAHQHLEGTGIGLANVARIAARHGGEVRAEGFPDKGASFYVMLQR